jgi:hypothetical protein
VKRTRELPEPFAPRSKIPFGWVLDELAALDPTTRPMFGCTAVYARGKIVFILREKGGAPDDGVWLATTRDHHPSLRALLPSMRSIAVFGAGETGWQVLPVEADGFEEEVLRACALVRADDARIGKVPKPKSKKAARANPEPMPKPTKAARANPEPKPKPKKRATSKGATSRRSPPARSSRSRRAL